VQCDFEATEREEANGAFRVEALRENGRDMRHLIDQDEFFVGLDHLRRALARITAAPVELKRVSGGEVMRFSLQQLGDAVDQLPAPSAVPDDEIAVEVFSHERVRFPKDPSALVPVVPAGPMMTFQNGVKVGRASSSST
jgi:hypothetical protein